MLRLVVVSALLAVAAAHPSGWTGGVATSYSSVHAPVVAYESQPITHIQKQVIPGRTLVEVQPRVAVVEQPYITKVGDQVHSVPTGVSHQSSSVVHSKNVVTPILAQGVQKHVVEAEPLVKHYQEPSIVKTIATQEHVSHAVAAPVTTYAAAPVATYAAAPVAAYSHGVAPITTYAAAPVATYAHGAAPVSWARVSAPVVAKSWAAPAAWSGSWDNSWSGAPVVKSAWGARSVVASPWSYGLGAKTVVASPWSYGYGAKSAIATPWASTWTGAHSW